MKGIIAASALGMLVATSALASPTHAGEDIRQAMSLLREVKDTATRTQMEVLIAQAEQAASDRIHEHAYVLARRAVEAGRARIAAERSPAAVQFGQR